MARKINRRAWNNNKRVRGTKLCDVNAQLSDRIHLHSLTQRKCKTHANARGAGTNLNFIELSLRRLSRGAVFRVRFNLVCATTAERLHNYIYEYCFFSAANDNLQHSGRTCESESYFIHSFNSG